jgi:hypothetical protein
LKTTSENIADFVTSRAKVSQTRREPGYLLFVPLERMASPGEERYPGRVVESASSEAVLSARASRVVKGR